MIAYQTDEKGVYIGEVNCQLSPLDLDETWLIPGGAVTKTPPKFGNGQQARWNGKKWIIEDVPSSIEDEAVFEDVQVEDVQVEDDLVLKEDDQ
jgi:hypothetical protein